MNRTLRHVVYPMVVAVALACAPRARAQVDVSIIGDTAHATIVLADDNGASHEAEVTIDFDSPRNLAITSLNLSAALFDPQDPLFALRLPAGIVVDPAFPMIVTVEPPAYDWIFASDFGADEDGSGALSFLNTYAFEIHTHDLVYEPYSNYRLLKAPVGGAFVDVTDDVLQGSTRARGRGGAFSQFIIGRNTVVPGLPALLGVILPKATALTTRLLTAVLGDVLRLQLTNLLTDVVQIIVGGVLNPVLACTNAIVPLDDFIADVEQGAVDGDIANLWRAQHDVVNDTGELLSLANTLRFSLLRCSAGH
jgi:hypothetical protein